MVGLVINISDLEAHGPSEPFQMLHANGCVHALAVWRSRVSQLAPQTPSRRCTPMAMSTPWLLWKSRVSQLAPSPQMFQHFRLGGTWHPFAFVKFGGCVAEDSPSGAGRTWRNAPLLPMHAAATTKGISWQLIGIRFHPAAPLLKETVPRSVSFPPHGVASQTCSATLRTRADSDAFLTCSATGNRSSMQSHTHWQQVRAYAAFMRVA